MKLLRDPRVILAGAIVLGAVIIAIALFVVPSLGSEKSTATDPCAAYTTSDERLACQFLQGYSSAARTASAKEETAWWASDVAQTVYAFLGAIVSLGGAGYAYYRVRARRQRLQEYMHRIDDLLTAHKSQPADGARALVAVRQEMRASFRAGRLEDAHFLELDKRATSAILKLRLLELDQRFPVLPPTLRHHVVTLMGDGTVSEAEVELVKGSLSTHLVPGRVREDLLLLLSNWAVQDSGDPDALAAGAAAPPRSPPNVLVKLKEP